MTTNLSTTIYDILRSHCGTPVASVLTDKLLKAFEPHGAPDLQARNDRQYAKIQNLEEDILDLARRDGPLQTQVKNLKDDATTLAKRNEGLEMLVVELQDRNEELEETTAKVEIANGEMCEAINRLIKERDNAAETAFNLKTRGTKQSRRIQNLERSLENGRAQGEKDSEVIADRNNTILSMTEKQTALIRGNAQMQQMNDSQATTIKKAWKDAEEASKRHCAEHSKGEASSHLKLDKLLERNEELRGINDSYEITIDNLKRKILSADMDLRKAEATVKSLRGNVSFLDEERNLLLKQRTSLQAKLKQSNWSELREQVLNQANRLDVLANDKASLQARLKSMATARDSLAGQLSEARGELITTNCLLNIEREGDMSSAKASELRNQSTYHMQRADQMATKLNKIQGILRNP